MDDLRTQDPDLYSIIQREIDRQNDGLELIASENFVSPPGDAGRRDAR